MVVACDGQEALDLLGAGLCPSLIVLDVVARLFDEARFDVHAW